MTPRSHDSPAQKSQETFYTSPTVDNCIKPRLQKSHETVSLPDLQYRYAAWFFLPPYLCQTQQKLFVEIKSQSYRGGEARRYRNVSGKGGG